MASARFGSAASVLSSLPQSILGSTAQGSREGKGHQIMGKRKKANATSNSYEDLPLEGLGEPVDVLKAGYIRDFISGLPVRATPEEIQGTQVFSKRLVEDYGYPKSHVITRPQHRVRARPSD